MFHCPSSSLMVSRLCNQVRQWRPGENPPFTPILLSNLSWSFRLYIPFQANNFDAALSIVFPFSFKASIPLEEPAAFMVDLLFICQTTTDQPLRAASLRLRSIIFFQPQKLDTQSTRLAQIQTSTMVAKTKRKRSLPGNRDTVVRVGENTHR